MAKAKTWEEYKVECEAVAKPGITILGWVGEWKGNKTKLKGLCVKHGEWHTTTIADFKRGRGCIDCSKDSFIKCRSKTWEDYLPSIQTVADKQGCIVDGYKTWLGPHTKLRIRCPIHGAWDSTCISNFIRGGGCPKCGYILISTRNREPDNIWVEEFIATGKFREGTTFKRHNGRKCKSSNSYASWDYTCPVCSEDEYVKAGVCTGVFTATTSGLKAGCIPCRCASNYKFTKPQWEYRLTKECKSRGYVFIGWNGTRYGNSAKFLYKCPLHGVQSIVPSSFLSGSGCALCAGQNQKQCYINMVMDGDLPVACKVGIARDSDTRLKKQNRYNLFQMHPLSVYAFPTVVDCKRAERACLSELRSGVLSARELKDGWTETVALTDYDKVVSIYERFGGVLVDTLTKEDM